MKVYITKKSIDGIRRVYEAQVKHLPSFGIEITDNIAEADVIACHGGEYEYRPGVPVVNHNHGLYWSRYPWGENYQEANQMGIEAMRRSVAVTAPSEWVATSLRRGMLIYPEVIYHGIDADEWEAPTEQSQYTKSLLPKDFQFQRYVLWNKAREDYVSDPVDMNEVAKLLPGVNFVSTLGKPAPNVKVIGPKRFDQMKHLVRDAGLYLCTTRETFGIGTLEAMACGVPVVGWNWGGQKEIIIHGETGLLANVRADNRYELLADLIKKAAQQRDVLGANARKDIEQRWGWESRIKQYASIYKRVNAYYNVQRRPKVSVIVTAYNLDEYLTDCLKSVQEQSLEDFECIVLGCPEFEDTKKIVEAMEDNRFVYMDTPADFGLTGRRNFGLKHAKSLYIRHLDADDTLAPRGLEIEAEALDKHDELHIVYGPMQNMTEDGVPIEDDNGRAQRWAEHDFNWYRQNAHINMIPSTCMARREVYEKSGGYRRRMRKAEDAHFWTLVTSLGFRAAKVTNATTMYHRMREDSKGALEWKADGTDGDWTAWIPWRSGPANNTDGFKYIKQKGMTVPYPELVPFGCVGKPPKGLKSWYVHDYAYPIVSVMVTVGPGHEKYLVDALDSIRSQTYPDWECIVINDTGTEWPDNYWDSPLSGFPFAKYVSTGGNYGVARARNIGAQVASGKLFVWMDADDYWLPWFLEKMVASYEVNRGIIYSDLFIKKPGEKKEELSIYQEFNCNRLITTGVYAGSSVIIPREVHQAVLEGQGGWDEDIPGQEDWDYQLACHYYSNICAYRVEEALFFYRFLPDGNREKHIKVREDIVEYMKKKWHNLRSGAEKLMCGCNNTKRINTRPSTRLMSSSPALQNVTPEDVAAVSEKMVLLEYCGVQQGAFTLRGPINQGVRYRFGLDHGHKVRKVLSADAKVFLAKRNRDGSPEFKIYQPERLPHEVMEFLKK